MRRLHWEANSNVARVKGIGEGYAAKEQKWEKGGEVHGEGGKYSDFVPRFKEPHRSHLY